MLDIKKRRKIIIEQIKSKGVVPLLDIGIELALCVIVFALPFSITIVEISFGCMLGCWILKRFLTWKAKMPLIRVFKPEKTSLNWPIVLFLIVGFLSIFTSFSFFLSVEGFFCKIFELIMTFFILTEVVSDRRKLNRIFIIMLFSMFFISVNGMVQFITGIDFIRHFCIYNEAFPAIRSSFHNPNDFSAWLIVMVALVLSFLINNKRIKRIVKYILLFLAGLLTACLVLTYSRGAWIAMLFALIFMGSLINRRVVITMIISALVLISFFASFNIVGENLRSIMKLKDKSMLIRLNLWKEALAVIEDFPVVGCGINTYTAITPYYKLSEDSGYYPHNSYLHMAAETGLAGLGAFLWIIGILFKTSIRNLKSFEDSFYRAVLIGLLSGLFGFLVHSIIDTNFYSIQLSVLMWYVMGLIVAVQRIEMLEKNKIHKETRGQNEK